MGLNEGEKSKADGISFLALPFAEPWRHPAVCAIAKITDLQLNPGRTWNAPAAHDTSGPLIQ